VGAGVHLALLALALGPAPLAAVATPLLLVVALPGAFVDVSAEMLHPGPVGSVALALAGSVVNGAAYAGALALARWVARRRSGGQGASR
jgi:hypothetical protein